MELRDLEYFKSVCDTESFTKAAQVLHISQPTITKAVHRLEEEIGVTLFDRNRSKKQITLTPRGKIFLARVKGILDSVEETMLEVQNYQKTEIKLGLPPIIGSAIFPSIYTKLLKQFPHLKFELIENGTNYMRDLIEKGEVDLGFIFQKSDTEMNRLNSIPLLRDELKVCVSKDHPFANMEKVSLDNLQWERFILLSESYLHNRIVISECEKNGYYPDTAFISKEIITVMSLVESGIGISLLSNMATRGHENIVTISLEDPIYLDVLLCWKKDHYLPSECQDIIDFIKSESANLC
jgi:DNA-binding transcriptional LysR family regulator